ncbi:uncharacterized protein LOC135493578 [Lineus longissimus]|uniref:uncharacterized protein LOC135493578 n=1 Tax=Lineus longissimus TaxID=88925 RepID=UPI00315D62DF
MVKAAKRALKTIISRADINDEEFHTFVVEAEGLINSRPLTPPSSDPNDDLPLTPNHFLHGQLGGQLAPPAVDELQRINPRWRWQRVQELLRHFWAPWQNELLPLFHNRKKWLYETKYLQNDSLCILVDEKLPRGQWRLAKVAETYPGSDGLVRAARVKTTVSEFLRPINRLSPLEFPDDQVRDSKKPRNIGDSVTLARGHELSVRIMISEKPLYGKD